MDIWWDKDLREKSDFYFFNHYLNRGKQGWFGSTQLDSYGFLILTL